MAHAKKDKKEKLETWEPFAFYTDLRNAWLRVPYRALVVLKLENEITGLSRRDKKEVYLEKEQDIVTFLISFFKYLGRPALTQEILDKYIREEVITFTENCAEIKQMQQYSPTILP